MAEYAFESATGWLNGARWSASPNFDCRPAGTPVELIVIHAISLPPGEFGGGFVEDLFLNRLSATAHPYFEAIAPVRVSAHFFIQRDGRLTQFVSTLSRAWHCGVSQYRGRDKCNDFSIGIELEGADDQCFETAQYDALRYLVDLLLDAHVTLVPDAIVGHSDIAPGRKTDPGPHFDWSCWRA